MSLTDIVALVVVVVAVLLAANWYIRMGKPIRILFNAIAVGLLGLWLVRALSVMEGF